MPFTDLTFNFGSLLTSTKMTSMFDNDVYNKRVTVAGSSYIPSSPVGSTINSQHILDTTHNWTGQSVHMIFNVAIKEDSNVARVFGDPLSWTGVGSTTYSNSDGFFVCALENITTIHGGQAEYSYKIYSHSESSQQLLHATFVDGDNNIFKVRTYANSDNNLELEFHREGTGGRHAYLNWNLSYRLLD